MNGKTPDGNNPGPTDALTLLGRAQECWNQWEGYRRERQRCKRFTYGNQWGDTIEDRGIAMPEEEFIRNQGNIPLRNNLIRRLVRNVLGAWRNRWTTPKCTPRDPAEAARSETMQRLLDYNAETNRLEELYARTMEEFLIGGLIVHKKWYGRKGMHTGCWTDTVAPDNFFVDTAARDFRGHDASLIGEFHDMDTDTLMASFADSPDRIPLLRGLTADGNGSCRIAEIWTRTHRPSFICRDRSEGTLYEIPEQEFPRINSENERRKTEGISPIETSWNMTPVWRYSFIAPDGTLPRKETPPTPTAAIPMCGRPTPLSTEKSTPSWPTSSTNRNSPTDSSPCTTGFSAHRPREYSSFRKGHCPTVSTSPTWLTSGAASTE